MLSIIIPVYNAENYIEETVKTIINQDFSDYEIIIVNDGSKDSSLDVCEKIRSLNNKVRVFSKENEGVSVARNFGVRQAAGEWITFVDADDGLIIHSLSCLDEVLVEDNDLYLFNYTSDMRAIDKSNGEVRKIDLNILRKCILNYSKYQNEIKNMGYKIDTFNNWTCWGKIYKKSIIIDNDIFFPRGITHGEDLVFLYEYYLHSQNAVTVERLFYFYRTDNDSVTRRFNSRRLINTSALLDILSGIIISSESDDFNSFICNRLFACCYLYFADRDNKSLYIEKIDELKSFCETELVTNALKKIDKDARWSVGTKTNIFMKMVLSLLASRKYGLTIFVSKMFNRI